MSVWAAETIRLLASRSVTLAIITGPCGSLTVPLMRLLWANSPVDMPASTTAAYILFLDIFCVLIYVSL